MTTTPATDAPLVSLRNASRHYQVGGGSLRAVDAVDLDIRRGETLALVGESGSGKTTLARLMLGLTAPSGGSVVVSGVDLATADRRTMRQFRSRVQIVFQDPSSSLDPRFTIGAIVAEGIEHLPRPERDRRVADILGRVGLPGDFADRFPHQLSGGQRQRVGIARALAVEPQLLVLDEPVAALDVSMQAQILNLLADLKEQFNLTYLFISHDLSVVRHVADRIAVMYMGRLIELAPGEQLFEAPQHPYTHALLSAAPLLGGTATRRIILEGDPPSPIDPPPYCRFAGRCFRPAPVCSEREPLLMAPRESDHFTACHFPGPLRPGEAGGANSAEEVADA